MRPIVGMTAVVVLALVVVSCDTTQPMVLDQQMFTLEMIATGAATREYLVYDGFEDSDGDGQPDDTDDDGSPDFFLHCLTRMTTGAPSVPTTGNPASVPWGYTVSITILRAGETEAELITSAAAATDPTLSLTEYDDLTIFGPVAPLAPITLYDSMTDTNRTFRFQNGRMHFEIRTQVMEATSNPLADIDPATYGTKGRGLCSTAYPGPVAVDSTTSTTYPREIVLRKGDTVTVQGLVSPDPPDGFTSLNPPMPALSASFLLDGRDVIVQGTTAETEPGSGLRFSYTTR